MKSSPATCDRRAFTLIELVVVVALIGIVAGMILPRLFDTSARRAEAAAESVRTLLSVAAHREALGGRRLAIDYEQERGSILLLSLRPVAGGGAEWAPDLLSPHATLAPLTLRSALLDGSALDARAWRIELPRHEPRRRIELVLERLSSARGPERWFVSLAPDADAATLGSAAPEAGESASTSAIDLDARGMGQQTW